MLLWRRDLRKVIRIDPKQDCQVPWFMLSQMERSLVNQYKGPINQIEQFLN